MSKNQLVQALKSMFKIYPPADGAPDPKHLRSDDVNAFQSPQICTVHRLFSFARLFAIKLHNQSCGPTFRLYPARSLRGVSAGIQFANSHFYSVHFRLKAMGCGMLGMLALQLSTQCRGPKYSHAFDGHQRQTRFKMQLRRVAAGLVMATLEACFREGLHLQSLKRFQTAAEKLREAVHGWHLPAHAELAWMLMFGREGGRGFRRRREESILLAEAGMQLGCTDCMGVAAYFYLIHTTLDDFRRSTALRLASVSAAAGSKYGMYMLSRFGAGTEQDRLKLQRFAADQGLDQAQFMMGLAYKYGDAVDRDTAEAQRWLRLASDQGHPDACAVNLSSLHPAATVHPIMTFAVPAAVDVAVVIANGQRAPEPHALANEPCLSALAPPPAAYSLWTAAKTIQVHPSSSSLAP